MKEKVCYMDIDRLEHLLNDIDGTVFASSAHASGQHRIFGYTTTNIRSVKTIAGYIIELLPEYIARKDNYAEWHAWFTDADVQERNKQKFKRLEVAKILFRNVESSKTVNEIGERLYRIYENHGRSVLEFVLYLYLLTGRYFDVDNQPLVETNKVLASWSGDFVSDATSALLSDSDDAFRPVLAMLFYNPASREGYEIAYALIQNEVSADGVAYLQNLSNDGTSCVWNRKNTAGGLNGFKSELAVILNYYLFRKSCEQNFENPTYETIVSDYVDAVFENGLNQFFCIDNKDVALSVLLSARIILKDVYEFALGIKVDHNFVKRQVRKNVKQEVFEKYGYKCFFDCVSTEDADHLAHELNYFVTQKTQNYLEGHHMIQMENSKFFEKDIDIVENIIPVCPNCHRKLHNADKNTVLKMLKMYYNNVDRNVLMRKGIFVDIETLERFYGIEGE